jgi:plasmid stability protein
MMSYLYHQDVRTTLTLDEDVAAKLKAETRRSGRSFKETVNEILRRGLVTRPGTRPRDPFKVVARDLGQLRPGLSLDNIADLLEQTEGPRHR